jgi:RND family efflux transporter MFP subunit
MSPDTDKPVLSRRTLRFVGIAAVVVAAVVIVMGITSRKDADAKLIDWTEKQAVPVVAVAMPDTHAQHTSIELPGRLEAYTQAQLFARVSGYLKEWKADIGTPVKEGQLLAVIDAPDLDQQYVQAQADLVSAQANARLSKATLERGKSLIDSQWISKQDYDQRAADYGNKQGLVSSAQANLDRLKVLEQYKNITAPFDGLVTARTTDVGALINAGNGGGPPLFVVSEVRRLRVFVNVPQTYVPQIKIGTKAQLSVPEYPSQTFTATVEASAQAVDVASGTTRMQLVVDNLAGKLMTGAYANVHLDLTGPAKTVTIPASALIFDKDGLRVATVDANNRIALKTVTIAHDLGKQIEIATGLSPDDRVVASPPDGVMPGDRVAIAGQPGGDAAGTASARRTRPASKNPG